MKKIILAASLPLLLAACASNGGGSAAADDAAAAIAAAESARSQAASLGYEWRDTAKFIASAQKAAEAKEYNKAVTLAGRAERQSVYAVKQHSDQADAAAIN
ncbi:MAG: hypothetical protein OQK94_05730 [Gammaproteobacteria bacterium]|nr:hypothetical protein [Gammaproteobacteria bacterium]MCW8841308.1 hypothetical protein [Gammaproteobacteria bacterium]MCW8928133.1 hypothetical protein [Gammaproteobacteria bacterium]MCW8958463.1 hypothetical protein [Gammaproteobacteria bacterium]MCW8971791.1 hypothetical protein [Gammaproteobacteria bacterium]